ncbi:hypothetical protein [Ramlibacter albus]|uniref:Uncharacterized protein n=1 Tax=Ramlibacter albus TaxID=2079448 RepID=A0A923S2Q6_9BURK|nr:hypothetical protein [Ramlibacter albus]MBC5765023.1 hypothetical protein [Ramlibacter albus]
MPDDPTPHGREVMHLPPDRARIPQPKPEAGDDDRGRANENMPSTTPASPQGDSDAPVTPSSDSRNG